MTLILRSFRRHPTHLFWRRWFTHRVQGVVARCRAQLGGDVLDVGCGDGLLPQRLTPVSRAVTAIDPDASAALRAAPPPKVWVREDAFDAVDPRSERFGLITFVASRHRMDTWTALAGASGMLNPGGTIAVVGLGANKTVRDGVPSTSVTYCAGRLGDWSQSSCRTAAVASGITLPVPGVENDHPPTPSQTRSVGMDTCVGTGTGSPLTEGMLSWGVGNMPVRPVPLGTPSDGCGSISAKMPVTPANGAMTIPGNPDTAPAPGAATPGIPANAVPAPPVTAGATAPTAPAGAAA
jgi:hypothetical protein